MIDMSLKPITIVVNDTPYRLDLGDRESLQQLSPADRAQLIILLEALKRQPEAQAPGVDQTREPLVDITDVPSLTAVQPGRATEQGSASTTSNTRLGSGDVDAIFAQLVMQENMNSKPPLTARSLYTFILGVAVVIVLLIVLL